MAQYSSLMTVMMQAVRKASRSVIRDYGEVSNLQISKKGTAGFVSSADFRVEKILKEELLKGRPKFGVLSEESPEIIGEDKSQRWIIDPIDGTHNFIHSLPYFCISIAVEQTLENGEKEIIAGLTHAPVLGEIFWAEKGRGAWFESTHQNILTKLRVANRSDLSESMAILGSLKRNMSYSDLLLPHLQGVRCIGSSALSLAYVAAGRCDAFFQSDAHLWDIAAGALMVKEAGGKLLGLANGKFIQKDASDLLASNEILGMKIQKILQPQRK